MLRSILRRSDSPQNAMQPITSMSFPSVTRVFADFAEDPFFAPFFNETRALMSGEGSSGMIPLDISEDDKSVIVRATVPGFKKDEIQIEVQDGVLNIHAEHEEKSEENNEKYHRRERRYGAFTRQVTLPTAVVEGQAKAELKDGVLTLRLPKAPEVQAKKIKIE